MQKVFFTPGPSQLYPTLGEHLRQALADNIGSISHRSGGYKAFHHQAVENLMALMDIPDTHTVLFFASATEIWERLIQNCVETGSFHFVNGAFSRRFFQIAEELQHPCLKEEAEKGKGFSFVQNLIPSGIDLLNFTHNESATGVMQPLDVVYEYKKQNPEILVSLDVVSSAPFPKLDYGLLDAVYFSVQKGMGLPAGLGVLIANEKVRQRAENLLKKGKCIGSYHRFPEMWEKALQFQTLETPNILNIYLLSKITEDMHAKGIEILRQEGIRKMQLLTEVVEKSEHFDFFVQETAFRSPTVIPLTTTKDPKFYLTELEKEGLIVGAGYSDLKSQQIRIANFPAHSLADFE